MVVPITLINPSRGGGGGGSGGNIVDASGTTGDPFVQVFDQAFSGGLIGIGSIVNTGAADMDVQETCTDKFGNTVSLITTVPAGDEYLLDLQANLDDGGGNLSLPPFIEYIVEVRSTVGGSPTSYELHFIDMTPGTGSGGGGTSITRAKDFVTYQGGDFAIPSGAVPGVIAGTTYNLVLDVAGKVTFTLSSVFIGTGTTPQAKFGLRIDGVDYICASIVEANIGGTFATEDTPMGGVIGVTLGAGAHTIDWIGCSSNGTPKIQASGDVYATMDVDYPSLSGGSRTPEAATFVVSPTAGVGDYMTIAQALAALPAEGGYLLLREGTYSLSASCVLPDKDVVIRGCGRGTFIDLGSNAIAAFQVGFSRTYKFEDLLISGDLTAGQIGIETTAVVTGQLTLLNVQIEIVETGILDTNEGLQASLIDSEVVALTPINLGSAATGRIVIDGNCIITTFTGTDAITFTTTPASLFVGPGSTISGNVAAQFGSIVGCWLIGNVILSNGSGVSLAGCRVTTGQIIATGVGHKVADCFLDTGGGLDAIDMQATDCVVTGCRWVPPGGGEVMVRESGAAEDNRYDDNTDFTGSVLLGTATLNGAKRADSATNTADAYATIVDQKNQRGLVGIGTVVNTDGADSLTVKETATDAFGNTVSLETVVLFGDSYMLDPQTNLDDGGGNVAYPPFVEYKVEIKSTSAGNPASYEMHFASQGAI